MQGPDGLWRLRDPRAARALRMNAGTIVGEETLGVRLAGKRGGGPKLGEIEEAFASHLSPGDTFLIGGQTVRFESMREMVVEVTPQPTRKPKIAVFSGVKLAVSAFLAEEVAKILNAPERWADLPAPVADWLRLQARYSQMPAMDSLLVETFPYAGDWRMAAHSFAGRNANQTLGLLVTKRMEEAGLDPLGFLATDYALLVWGLAEVTDPEPLFDADGLREGLEQWLASNAVMKRTFRSAAIIAGLIERNLPGRRKTGRQTTFSSDILYDTLRKYDPGHLMLEITRREAQRGLVDFDRIEAVLAKAAGRIRPVRADRVTPLSAPLLLELGKVPIRGAAEERLLAEVESVIDEALRR